MNDNGGVISGWTYTGGSLVGLNPAGGSPFANNGATPDGTNVAFVQSAGQGASLATTITGLTPGANYAVTFRANGRADGGGISPPEPTWSLNGGAFVAFTASPAVNALDVFTNPYYTNSGMFTATGNTAGLVLSNNTAGGSTVLVDDFRIVASPVFTNVPIADLPGLFLSSVAWGDYDNDGRLDFLLTGGDSSFNPVSQLWRNTVNGFTNVTVSVAPSLPGVYGPSYGSSVAWGDYDNDGRLDFLLTGWNGSTDFSQLWRNNTAVTNTPPSAPTGLAMTATTNAVMLSWNSATDGQTPATGLTYNVRAGSTPGGIDLFAGHVTATNGFRRVPAMGNAYLRHTPPLTGLTNGQTVYWSVQAVDTAFAGGPFASETSEVTIPQLNILPNTATNALLLWTPPTFGWVLQTSPDLAPVAWSNAPSGALNPVLVPLTNEQKTYYRIIAP